MKTGLLLINLGTPDAPTEEAVRDYLNVFLSDPYVITLPKLLRDFLVQKIILPKRPRLSAHAYQQIWTKAGSPLLVNSVAFQTALSQKLGDQYCVALGMRYGNPSIDNALSILKENQCDKIIVLVLFPQFANATTQSALDVVNALLKNKYPFSAVRIIQDFFDQDFYITPQANLIKKSIEKNNAAFILMSYHGLPARHRGAEEYRRQCYVTSQLIAEKIGLRDDQYQVSFQSRLGFTKWITPYTDHVVKALRKKNITQLSVACPSFVADCVETLEEVNMRLREQWMALGGESFELIPCLNANAEWVDAVAGYIAPGES